MTTKPASHMLHSGFVDLATLIASTPSRIVTTSKLWAGQGGNGLAPSGGRKKREEEWSVVAEPGHAYLPVNPADQQPKAGRGNGAGRGGRAAGAVRGGKRGGGREEFRNKGELRRRKVDKRMIGPPMDFRHIFHASTFEEATELLLRWSLEGVDDKLGDPSWAMPIKELVKARAREQQARAVAAVVEATARSRLVGSGRPPLHPPGQLHVVNGLPSSIYSTTNTSLVPLPSPASRQLRDISISPLLANGSTPNLIANFPGGYFDPTPPGLQTPGSPLVNPFATPPSANAEVAPQQVALPKKTQPLAVKKKSVPPVAAINQVELGEIKREISGTLDTAEAALTKVSKVKTVPPGAASPGAVKKQRRMSPPAKAVPFRVVKPSLETLEKAMSIALFFEQYYHSLLRVTPANYPTTAAPSAQAGNYVLNRARRLAQLEASFLLPENRFMSEGEKDARREELIREENHMLRERRRKVDVRGFEMGRVIGHGAFGVVRIARERQTERLVAIKQLRKADMLRKSQEGHVKAEKDLLAAAASHSDHASSRIVQLFYAFQDTDHLYLVLEYMGGGDLLNLLVERDTFSEPMTRFYVAEMVLALQETHSLGYVHRDIKPDNFLFDPEGHLKVSDFGLATDLHWAHDTNYYEAQRQALLKKHGVDLEVPSGGGGKTRRMKRAEVERIMGKEWLEEGKGVLTWRDKNRKRLAYSICGTNSYMAPEVIRGQGYGFSCDWWSLGVIMYESLYGYPPFVSSSRHVTRQKILNWKTTLKFPPKPRLSAQCVDLMASLLCEPEDRIGSQGISKASILTSRTNGTLRGSGIVGLGQDGAEQIKAHPWFRDIDWDHLHSLPAPYQPDLATEDDTKHFDQDIPNEPLAPAGGAGANATKDPLLRHATHGANLLEIRKSLAFKGWTFKAPLKPETRYGHIRPLSSGGGSNDSTETLLPHHGVESLANGLESLGIAANTRPSRTGMGTVRSRALSL